MGNAGNQFFQYAFARVLQEKYGGELVINYEEVASDKFSWSGSDNLLKEFNVVPYEYTLSDDKNPHKVLTKYISKVECKLHLKAYTVKTYKFCLFIAKHFEKFGIYYFSAAFFPFRFPRQRNIYLKGYFESPLYFREIDDKICEELKPRHEVLDQNRELYEKICSSQSVCISIKRMDVDNDEISDIYEYDINYFYHAVDYIQTHVDSPVWFVFSDNIEWCKENFHIDGEVHFETEGNPIWEKVRLMSSCKHFIIHNSTFSWWVQHLSQNRDKIVITPARWMIRDDQPIDIYEDYFVYMDNQGNVLDYHL